VTDMIRVRLVLRDPFGAPIIDTTTVLPLGMYLPLIGVHKIVSLSDDKAAFTLTAEVS
jgi:hypothetical protein